MAPSSRKLSVPLAFAFFICSTLVACGGASVAPEAPTDLGGPSALSGGPGLSGACTDEPWSLTGNMAQGRQDATATRLADGSVVVAGGMDENGSVLPGAERYNSATDTWSAAGTLMVPRYWHRAVRLQDGRVLVVGGLTDSGDPTATAEIYNPATNAWSPAAPMSTPRYVPQVTALQDGRVLASGGLGAGMAALATAEIYDPALNRWSMVGSMTSPRFAAAVALLPNGKVLVAGGSASAGAYLSSAEIFDPSARTWTAALPMSVARYTPGMAVLPDGRALVAGGTDQYPGAEIFNPASGTWSPTTDMAQVPRWFFETIPLADGRVMVAGGFGSSGLLDGVEIFDPGLGLWMQSNAMNMPRYTAVSAQLPDGRILIAGGYTRSSTGAEGVTNTAETTLLCPPNLPPVAVCANRVVSAGPTCTGTGSVNNGSYDPDNGPGPLTISQWPAGPYSLGNSAVTLIASDGQLQSTCSATVTVVDQTPPQITCPSQQFLECVNGGAAGTFTAQVTDNCGGGTATCSPSGVTLSQGDHTVTCSATDGSGNRSSCSFTASVRDTRAPVAGTSKGMTLWPADGLLHEVSLMDCANFTVDACSGRLNPLKDYAVITKITSDEVEDAPGDSDGNTLGDMQIKKPWLALLRAERTTARDGRVYTVHYRVTDPAGNSANAFCKVTVPVVAGTLAVEGPPLYCVGPDCP